MKDGTWITICSKFLTFHEPQCIDYYCETFSSWTYPTKKGGMSTFVIIIQKYSSLKKVTLFNIFTSHGSYEENEIWSDNMCINSILHTIFHIVKNLLHIPLMLTSSAYHGYHVQSSALMMRYARTFPICIQLAQKQLLGNDVLSIVINRVLIHWLIFMHISRTWKRRGPVGGTKRTKLQSLY